jgi:nucleotide-binding universal stress UspA family protein
MLNLKKVLFPTDFTRCSNQAFSRAWSFANSYHAQLHLFHAMVLNQDDPLFPAYYLADMRKINDSLVKTAMDRMESLISSYNAHELEIIKMLEFGNTIAPVILDYANKEDVDLIVMGTHGRRGIGHLLLGSVAEEIVRTARCPVMTIREQEKPKQLDEIERILVPIDFSEFSLETLKAAKAIASEYGAKLDLLHVVEQSIHPSFYIEGKTTALEVEPVIKTKSVETMAEMLESLAGESVEADYHLSEGSAAQEISRFSNEHESDLLVISTHGLTGIEHFLLGSVAEKVVRMAEAPVLTVKSFGKSIVRVSE